MGCNIYQKEYFVEEAISLMAQRLLELTNAELFKRLLGCKVLVNHGRQIERHFYSSISVDRDFQVRFLASCILTYTKSNIRSNLKGPKDQAAVRRRVGWPGVPCSVMMVRDRAAGANLGCEPGRFTTGWCTRGV